MENFFECAIVKTVLDLVGSETFAHVFIKISSLYKYVGLFV